MIAKRRSRLVVVFVASLLLTPLAKSRSEASPALTVETAPSLETAASNLIDIISREGLSAGRAAIAGANAVVIVNDGSITGAFDVFTWLHLSVGKGSSARSVLIPPRSSAVVFLAGEELPIAARFCGSGGWLGQNATKPNLICDGVMSFSGYTSKITAILSGRKLVVLSSESKGYSWWYGYHTADLVEKDQWLSGLWADVRGKAPQVVTLDVSHSTDVSVKSLKQLLLERESESLRVARAISIKKLKDTYSEIDAGIAELIAIDDERARMEKVGDGSADDLVCKAKNFAPATSPYRLCRTILVQDRQRDERREKERAEKQERERAERERLAALEAERKAERERALAERQKQARLERERLAALEAERKAERERLAALEAERKAELVAQAERDRYYADMARERRAAEMLAAAREADPFYDAKAQCRKLGFKPTTEKFGTCVLELSRRQPREETPVVQSGDGSPDDTTCRGYGFSVGTSGYSNCRMTLDNARQSYERELQAYEAAKAEYQRRTAEAEAEAQRARAQRQAQAGYCLTQCRGGFLECFARCSAQSAGVNYDPGPEPMPPSRRTTYSINGQIINCNTSLSGSLVTCN